MTGPSIAHSAARGLLFTLVSQALKILLQLVSVVLLARLLNPHDYGLLALVLVVVGVGEIFRDFGLTPASIQAETLDENQRTNLFWVNFGLGVLLTTIVFCLSWMVSSVTGEPEMLGILHWMSLAFMFNGVATQHRASLFRALRFRAVAVIDIVAATLGLGVAVVWALLSPTYWALVAQQLITAASAGGLALAFARWLPGLPTREGDIRGLVKFGSHLVGSNLVTYVGSQVDTVLVGTRFGVSTLGLYNRAYQLVMTPLGQIRGPVNSVAQPVFARVQTDIARFERYVVAGQLALGYGLGLPLALLAALAYPLVAVLLGPTWLEAAPILALFALAAFLTNLAFVGYWVYVSRGLVKNLFRFTLVSLAIRVICLLTGSFFGVLGVAIGFAAAPAFAWPLSIWWLSRLTPMPVRALYLGAARVMVLCGTVAIVAWLLGTQASAALPAPAQVAIGATASLVAVAALAIPAYRRDARILARFGKLMLRRVDRLS